MKPAICFDCRFWQVRLLIIFIKGIQTAITENLIKDFKILAIQIGKRQNELLEEGIRGILKKYEKQPQK